MGSPLHLPWAESPPVPGEGRGDDPMGFPGLAVKATATRLPVLIVDLSSMADLDNDHHELFVLDLVNDPVDALADAIPLLV